jgi:hypothetical protein
MSIVKRFKDQLIKVLLGDSTPRGLFEVAQYFRHYGAIDFEIKKEEGLLVAVSTNFRHGSIVTNGRTEKEIDANIKDAILTAFEIPSSYAKEVPIVRQSDNCQKYALA